MSNHHVSRYRYASAIVTIGINSSLTRRIFGHCQPGNEWYRRLVKSNRPLYRACPKHTKLLVAKAIVQAVEQQQGRFLEKSRSNGLWYQVSYKRAVDKTSQGLREKDREGNEEEELPPFPETATPTDATVLARQMSTREPPPVPGARPMSDYTQPVAPRTQQSLAQGVTPSIVPNAWINHNTGGTAATANTMTTDGGLTTEEMPTPLDSVPRDQSMFRLLKHTSLLPTTSLEESQVVEQQRKSNELALLQQQQQRQLQNSMRRASANTRHFPYAVPTNNTGQQPQQQHQRLQFPTGASLYMGSAVSTSNTGATTTATSSSSSNKLNFSNAPPAAATDAPSFTRFQSQVSDWLNSFWPLNEGEQPSSNKTSAPASFPPPAAPLPPPATPAISSKLFSPSPSRKRKAVRHSMEPLVEDQTEADTSPTLLQYATSSKLFRGLSVLFGGDEKPAATPQNTTTTTTKPSLLDDYEETPMEARMRQVE